MRRFAALCDALDASASGDDQQAALQRYFDAAPAADAAWAVHLLVGGRPQPALPAARTAQLLRDTACALAGIDAWLFDASLQAVGDLAETVAHLLPPPQQRSELGLAAWIEQRLLPLRGLPDDEQALKLRQALAELDAPARLVFIKLASGGFRSAVDALQLQQALARHAGIDAWRVAQRLTGWADRATAATAERYRQLLSPSGADGSDAGRPCLFGALRPLTDVPTLPGAIGSGLIGLIGWRVGLQIEWQIEWQFDGLRVQLVRRAGQTWIWSCAGALLNDRLPELVAAARALPDGCVLDGVLLAWRGGDALPLPSSRLQQRLARKTLTRQQRAEVPLVLVAFDLLQLHGADQRDRPLQQRRTALQALLGALLDGGPLRLSPSLPANDGDQLTALHTRSRQQGARGLVLKRCDAAYGVDWWAWQAEALTLLAVLVYVQASQGRRGAAEFSFAVWSRRPRDAGEAQAVAEELAAHRTPAASALQLLTCAKTGAGLNDADRAAVEALVRDHTLQRFGPVRSVRPLLVIELECDRVDHSARHKSGLALQGLRMLRIRHDKALHQADDLPTLQGLITNP